MHSRIGPDLYKHRAPKNVDEFAFAPDLSVPLPDAEPRTHTLHRNGDHSPLRSLRQGTSHGPRAERDRTKSRTRNPVRRRSRHGLHRRRLSRHGALGGTRTPPSLFGSDPRSGPPFAPLVHRRTDRNHARSGGGSPRLIGPCTPHDLRTDRRRSRSTDRPRNDPPSHGPRWSGPLPRTRPHRATFSV